MGDTTGISWTDRTYNPWQGCAKVSDGCKNCYMFRDKKRYGQDPEVVVRSSAQTWNRPIRWNKDAAVAGRKELVFTCSWSDWFIKEADPWRDEAWSMIKNTPNLIYQILTKRPSRILANLPADWGNGYPNVWLGVSAENQDEANRRIPLLLEAPAVVKFVSIEPQLSLVELTNLVKPTNKVDWVIYGGESGDSLTSRPIDPEWIRIGLAECKKLDIAAFVKQMGSCWARKNKASDSHGADLNEWPNDLRIREFPKGV